MRSAIRRNRRAFQRAHRKAGEEGMVVGYYDTEGTPQYLVTPRGASDDTITGLIFQAVHGRPMNRAEEILAAAQRGDFLRAYEEAMEHYLGGFPGEVEVTEELGRAKD